MMLIAGVVVVVSLSGQVESPAAHQGVDVELVRDQRNEPRLRAGIGLGFGLESFGSGGAGGGFGLVGEVGLQVNDRWAVYLRTTAETALLVGSASAAVLAEVGFDRLSVSTGFGGTAAYFVVPGGGTSAAPVGLLIPLVVGITPVGRADDSVARRGVHLWLEGDLTFQVGGTTVLGGRPFRPGGGASLFVGYVWR
jgi:hypothetical protein